MKRLLIVFMTVVFLLAFTACDVGADISDINNTLNDLQSRIEELESENSRLTDEINALSNPVDGELSELAGKISSLKDEIDTLTQEKSELDKSLSDEIARLDGVIAALESELESIYQNTDSLLDWDNPLVINTYDFFDAYENNHNEFIEKYYYKVVEITGTYQGVAERYSSTIAVGVGSSMIVTVEFYESWSFPPQGSIITVQAVCVSWYSARLALGRIIEKESE